MRITTKYGIRLKTYYRTHLPRGRNCQANNKTFWWRFTPYDLQETLYYICKHLALPLFGIILLLLFLIFRFLNILVSDLLISFLLYGSVLTFFSVVRENIRLTKYRIKNGKIEDNYDYDEEEEELLFQIGTNNLSQTNIRIGFVGDIMRLKNYRLQFDPQVKNFFSDVDLIVGNFEGIIYNSRWPRLTKQKHRDPPVLCDLKRLISCKTKWLLSLSNNHTNDYGNIMFCNTLKRIQRHPKFNVFGNHLVPTVLCEYKDPDTERKRNDVSISTVSEWCNQKKWDCFYKYEDARIKTLHRFGKFNILYPHWSYENEKYVRSRIQKDAKTLLTGKDQNYSLFQRFVRKYFVTKITPFKYKKWDLIFGQHPHVRQPIMVVVDDFIGEEGNTVFYKKLVAFSGGNFTSGATVFRKKKHIRGIILKCDIGPLEGHSNKLVVGNVKWRRTVIKKLPNQVEPTKIVRIDSEKYRTYNYSAFIGGVVFTILFSLMLLFRLRF